MRKIAFCFLIYDIINHEELWNLFFNNIDPNKYSIYIHYKNNISLKYFNKYKLKKRIQTKYADISLVKAQNILLYEALKDLDNTNIIFLSGSCIPVKPFDYIYNILKPEYSYFSEVSQNGCFPRCDLSLEYVDKKYIFKTSQWCIINRRHADLMLKYKDYLKWFSKIYAADEHCYITNIMHHNLENEICNEFDPTYVNWSKGGPRPLTYNSITDENLLLLVSSKHLFARKFDKGCDLSALNDHIVTV
jgi:hypothetical protein